MVRPRALFDTNLFLNYLMSPAPAGTAVDAARDAGAEGQFDLLLPEDVIEELAEAISERPDLSSRIGERDVNALLDRVLAFARRLPQLEETPPSISRDPNDDYLLVLATTYAVDILVTRDHDLLDLGEVQGVKIVDPAAFLALLRSGSW